MEKDLGSVRCSRRDFLINSGRKALGIYQMLELASLTLSAEPPLDLRGLTSTGDGDGKVYGLGDHPLPPYQTNSSLYIGEVDPKGSFCFYFLGQVPLEQADTLAVSGNGALAALGSRAVTRTDGRVARVMRTLYSRDKWQTFQTLLKSAELPEFEYNETAWVTSDNQFIFLRNLIDVGDPFSWNPEFWDLSQNILRPLKLIKKSLDYFPVKIPGNPLSNQGSIPELSAPNTYTSYTNGFDTDTGQLNSYGRLTYDPKAETVKAEVRPVTGLEGENLGFGARIKNNRGEDYLLLISKGTDTTPDCLYEVPLGTGELRRITTSSNFHKPGFASRIEKILIDNGTTYLLMHNQKKGPRYIEENFYVEYFENGQAENESAHFKLTKEGNIYYDLTPPADLVLVHKRSQRFLMLSYKSGIFSLEVTGGIPEDRWHQARTTSTYKLYLPLTVKPFDLY